MMKKPPFTWTILVIAETVVILSILFIPIQLHSPTQKSEISVSQLQTLETGLNNTTNYVNLYISPVYNYSISMISNNTIPTPTIFFNYLSNNTTFLTMDLFGTGSNISLLFTGMNQSSINNYTMTVYLGFIVIELGIIEQYQGEFTILSNLHPTTSQFITLTNIENVIYSDQNMLQNDYVLMASLQLNWEGHNVQ